MMNPTTPYRPFAGGYVSEFEQFMAAYLARHPEAHQEQRRGWDIWWDRQIDLGELDKQRADTVPEPPYHYE
jgi:hypothetical protein